MDCTDKRLTECYRETSSVSVHRSVPPKCRKCQRQRSPPPHHSIYPKDRCHTTTHNATILQHLEKKKNSRFLYKILLTLFVGRCDTLASQGSGLDYTATKCGWMVGRTTMHHVSGLKKNYKELSMAASCPKQKLSHIPFIESQQNCIAFLDSLKRKERVRIWRWQHHFRVPFFVFSTLVRVSSDIRGHATTTKKEEKEKRSWGLWADETLFC